MTYNLLIYINLYLLYLDRYNFILFYYFNIIKKTKFLNVTPY